MKQLTKYLILLIVAVLGVTSCGSDEPDGKWERMKWTNVNDLKNVNGVYILPEENGTYTFLCRNYEQPWFTSFTVNGVQQTVSDNHSISGDWWFTAKFEGNKLLITVGTLPKSVDSRDFTLNVTAGDIFDSLIFRQEKGAY